MLLAFVDTPQRHDRLSIFPVVAADEPELSYLLMTDALARGILIIDEPPPGEAPCLIARNRGSEPVLILDCETVEGLGTKLTTNQSVLLGPGSVTKVPIVCTDAGKWSCRELERQFAKELESFPLLTNQVGILAFLGQSLLGLDVLGCPHLYSPLHPRLLTGYLVAALAWGRRAGFGSCAEEPEIQALTRALERARRVAAPSPGHGEYTTLHGEVTGGELRHNGHLVHLSVFPNGAAA